MPVPPVVGPALRPGDDVGEPAVELVVAAGAPVRAAGRAARDVAHDDAVLGPLAGGRPQRAVLGVAGPKPLERLGPQRSPARPPGYGFFSA